MKAILICPDPRPPVAMLSEATPLAMAPLLGKCLLEYWIEHLAELGVRQIGIAASDRASQIRSFVGDGERWGLPIAVEAEDGELSVRQALEKYGEPGELPPLLIVEMDHLPGQADLPLLSSYAAWFHGLQAWMPRAQKLERIGQCEVQPGIWVGLRARISPAAVLLAPCWLGDHVWIEGGAVIGPSAILEEGAVVGAGARIARSVIGRATFVGAQTLVENSLAQGGSLLNWAGNSRLRVPDAFWLCSLSEAAAVPRRDTWPEPVTLDATGSALIIAGLTELTAANAGRFRAQVRAALSSSLSLIEIDLARARYVDGRGLSALCGLHRDAGVRGIRLRLLNPEPPLRQLLELTQMHRFLEIGETEVSRPGRARGGSPFPSAPVAIPAH